MKKGAERTEKHGQTDRKRERNIEFVCLFVLEFNPFPKQTHVFMCLQYKSFENTFFPPFLSNLKLSSANSFNLKKV